MNFWRRLTGLQANSSCAATAFTETAAAAAVRCCSSAGVMQVHSRLLRHTVVACQETQVPDSSSSGSSGSSCSSTPINSDGCNTSRNVTCSPASHASAVSHPMHSASGSAQSQHKDATPMARRHTTTCSKLPLLPVAEPIHHGVSQGHAMNNRHLCQSISTLLPHRSHLLGFSSYASGSISMHSFQHSRSSSNSSNSSSNNTSGTDSSAKGVISTAVTQAAACASSDHSGAATASAAAGPAHASPAQAVNTSSSPATAAATAAAAGPHHSETAKGLQDPTVRSVDTPTGIPAGGSVANGRRKKANKEWDEDDEDDDEAWTTPVPLDPEAEEQPGIVYLLAAAVASSVMAVTVAGLLMAGTFYAGLYLNGVMRQVDQNKQHRAAQQSDEILPPPPSPPPLSDILKPVVE